MSWNKLQFFYIIFNVCYFLSFLHFFNMFMVHYQKIKMRKSSILFLLLILAYVLTFLFTFVRNVIQYERMMRIKFYYPDPVFPTPIAE